MLSTLAAAHAADLPPTMVLAALLPKAPAGYTLIPESWAVILSSLVLLWAVVKFGNRLSWVTKFDNWIRLVIVILGIIVPALTLPLVGDLSKIFKLLLDHAVSNTNIANVIFFSVNILALVLAGIGAYLVYAAPDHKVGKAVLIMLILSSWFLLGIPQLQTASAWYVHNIAIGFVWNFIMGFWDGLTKLQLHPTMSK